jgi:hypothetical protein
MFITQISVYLENNKGTLRSLTKILGQNDIDLLALSIADTTHFGIIRIIVREKDVEFATNVLRENGFISKVNHVICVAVPNKPAGLDSVLEIIEKNNISIEYMYSLNYIIEDKALMILRLSKEDMDKEQIVELLTKSGLMVVKQDDINCL